MRNLFRRLVERLLPWYDRREQEARYARSIVHRREAEKVINRLGSYHDVRLPRR